MNLLIFAVNIVHLILEHTHNKWASWSSPITLPIGYVPKQRSRWQSSDQQTLGPILIGRNQQTHTNTYRDFSLANGKGTLEPLLILISSAFSSDTRSSKLQSGLGSSETKLYKLFLGQRSSNLTAPLKVVQKTAPLKYTIMRQNQTKPNKPTKI